MIESFPLISVKSITVMQCLSMEESYAPVSRFLAVKAGGSHREPRLRKQNARLDYSTRGCQSLGLRKVRQPLFARFHHVWTGVSDLTVIREFPHRGSSAQDRLMIQSLKDSDEPGDGSVHRALASGV